jgi:hypothetical protein
MFSSESWTDRQIAIAATGGATPMLDLELARVIHADRQRQIERDLRVRAFRRAQVADADDTFVPAPDGRLGRITHVVRLTSSPRRG